MQFTASYTASPELRYAINFTTTGVYTVWLRLPKQVTSAKDRLIVKAIGDYGIQAQVELTITVAAFQEQEGQVTMEAEHFAWSSKRSNREWITQTTLVGYSDKGYVSALPDTDLQFTTSYTASPELNYTINFTTTGVYTQ